MKAKLLAIALVAVSIFGISCEKNDLTDKSQMTLSGRGDIGESGGQAYPLCSDLLIEKDAQNNDYQADGGGVCVWNDADWIYFEFNTEDGYIMKQTNVWAGPYDDACVNGPGNPLYGKFLARNLSVPDSVNTDYTMKVPVSSIGGAGSTGIVIAQSNIFKHNEESSWMDNRIDRFSLTGKATYLNYTVH